MYLDMSIIMSLIPKWTTTTGNALAAVPHTRIKIEPKVTMYEFPAIMIAVDEARNQDLDISVLGIVRLPDASVLKGRRSTQGNQGF